MKCLIQLFSATVFQEYSLKNSCRWTTPPPCYLTFIMCFYLGAEGHIGCLKTLLKDTLVVWRCWKYWAGCLATLSVTWWGKSNMTRKKEKEKMSPKNGKKRLSRPKNAKKWGQKILPSNQNKKIFAIKRGKAYHKKRKKKSDNKIKKRWVIKDCRTWIITTMLKTEINENPYHRNRKAHCLPILHFNFAAACLVGNLG